MPSLYNCKHATDAYRITKFNSDLEVESSYLCTVSTCECPAGHRPKCRHREMLPKFIRRGMVDANWFFDYDRGGWVEGWQEPESEPELTIAHEVTLPADASSEQVAEAFGNLLTPAGLGQASDPELYGTNPMIVEDLPAIRDHNEAARSRNQEHERVSPLLPSPSPTIRRRV